VFLLFISRSIDERTLVYFADNPQHLVEAYVDSGEGLDCAGGFNVAVRNPLSPSSLFFSFLKI
jgi:Maf-like protein